METGMGWFCFSPATHHCEERSSPEKRTGSLKHLIFQDKCVSSALQLFSFGVALPGLAGEEIALRIGGILNVAIGNGSGTIGTAGESDAVVFQRKGIKGQFRWNTFHPMINILYHLHNNKATTIL